MDAVVATIFRFHQGGTPMNYLRSDHKSRTPPQRSATQTTQTTTFNAPAAPLTTPAQK